MQKAQFISTYKAAKRLQISAQSVRRYCEDGTLKASRIKTKQGHGHWRVDTASVDRLVETLSI